DRADIPFATVIVGRRGRWPPVGDRPRQGVRMSQTSTVPGQPGPRDAPEATGRGERLRVLLVEDDEGDAFLVQELLDEAKAPIDLTVARTLALARGQLRGVDCVLLDL